jgi:dTDP-4-amino-4,6-dideoxygalactose transaminase
VPRRPSAAPGPIPVYAASLPRAAALIPYLERIDAAGRYSNRGPLVQAFEARLCDTLGVAGGGVATTSSGTAAIQAAILAAAGRAASARPIALVPGYTFAATAHAAEACGYRVVFADVEPDSWVLSAARLRAHPDLARTGLVLPVAAYGRPHGQDEWAAFGAATGIPVVIDGASSFEAIRRNPAALIGSVPVAISLHATKTFSAAEGGAVVWTDAEGLARVKQLCNFGFLGLREVGLPGFNGKLSEYHAAVGLASLDGVDAIETEREARSRRFIRAAARAGLSDAIVLWPAIASHYALWQAPTLRAAALGCAALTAAGIEWRRWYGAGLHLEPYFAQAGRPQLPVTEDIAARLIGIPYFAHIEDSAIERILSALREAMPCPLSSTNLAMKSPT